MIAIINVMRVTLHNMIVSNFESGGSFKLICSGLVLMQRAKMYKANRLKEPHTVVSQAKEISPRKLSPSVLRTIKVPVIRAADKNEVRQGAKMACLSDFT